MCNILSCLFNIHVQLDRGTVLHCMLHLEQVYSMTSQQYKNGCYRGNCYTGIQYSRPVCLILVHVPASCISLVHFHASFSLEYLELKIYALPYPAPHLPLPGLHIDSMKIGEGRRKPV